MTTRIILLSIIILIFIGCEKPQENPQPQMAQQTQTAGSTLSGEITEFLQTPSYTYLNVKDNVQQKWIAVKRMEVEVGKTIYYEPGMEMKDFESKTLNRVFPSVWFVSKAGFAKSTQQNKSPSEMPMANPHQMSQKKSETKSNVSVEKKQGELTIAELYKNLSKYDGKVITIKGKVTKFNANIMDRNWVHLQDGTDFNGKFDLTITTAINCKPGDIVTFSGKITLNKDFGAGYKYEVIMEQAKKL